MKNSQKMNIYNIYNVSLEKEKLLEAKIELNTLCNLNCVHCYLPKHENKGFTLKKVYNILDELRSMGVYEISFTGGEIFLRDDIFEIIEYARNLGFSVILFSNIILLDEKKIEKLSKLYINKISCTLFSMNDFINDEIMKKKGSLNKIIKNIDLLIKYKINIEVKTVLMNKNIYDYKEIQKFCKERKIETIFTPVVTIRNDGDTSPINFRIEHKQLETLFKDTSLGLLVKKNDNLDNFICNKIRYSIFIDSNGYVYPCDTFSHKYGNVYEKSISEIWNSKDMKEIRNLKIKDVYGCRNCNKIEYCYKCPGISQLENGSIKEKSSLACEHAEVRYNLRNYL